MRVQSEQAGLWGQASALHGLLPAQEGGTHFWVAVSTSGQELQENIMLSTAQHSPNTQGLGRDAGDHS